jgi:hypothetical protein
MSSRFKKKQNRELRKKTAKKLTAKWYDAQEFDQLMDEFAQYECDYPQTVGVGCTIHGTLFVRPIMGSYKKLSNMELSTMINNSSEQLEQLGVPLEIDPFAPLWMQAEHLESSLEYELNPPCGCKSAFATEMAN